MPYGIFKERTLTLAISQTGGRVVIEPIDGVRYFYTIDGSDPYTNCPEPAKQLDFTLKNGQILTVFAAKQGFYDSEIVTVSGGRS